MAVKEGGVPPILAQQHYTQRSAFAPENLLREACGQQQITRSGIPDIRVLDHDGGRVENDFKKGELDGNRYALQLIVTAADLRRSRLSP